MLAAIRFGDSRVFAGTFPLPITMPAARGAFIAPATSLHRRLLLAAVLLSGALCWGNGAGSTTNISVNFSGAPAVGRPWHGVGGLSGGGATSTFLFAYSPKAREEILDLCVIILLPCVCCPAAVCDRHPTALPSYYSEISGAFLLAVAVAAATSATQFHNFRSSLSSSISPSPHPIPR